MMSNTLMIKIILSRDIHFGNFFFSAFRNQFTRLEIEVTSNGTTSSLILRDIPKSTSDTISQWMTANHNKLPFHNELTETNAKKVLIGVISGGY